MTDTLSFRTSDELGNKIRELADLDFEGNLSQAVNKLMEKALNMENRYSILDDQCPARCFIDDHYECRWGRMGKTPDTKKIGKTIDAVNEGCVACKKTLDMKDRLLTMEQELEKGKVIFIPSCKRGAEVSEDMTRMYCPQIGAWRPIKERKKKKDYIPCREAGRNKSNCEYLKHIQTVIKGKLPEGQNL